MGDRKRGRPLLVPLLVAGRLLMPGASRSSVYQAAAEGRIPVRRIGGRKLAVSVFDIAQMTGAPVELIWKAIAEDGGDE